ncbi:MAG: family 20 glycosylhydrolase [Deinococcales bacterium]
MPVNLIPQPLSLDMRPNSFFLDAAVSLIADSDLLELVALLNQHLKQHLGFELQVAPLTTTVTTVTANANAANRAIQLSLDPALTSKHPEAYTLDISPLKVDLKAASASGLAVGLSSLRQLIMSAEGGKIPCLAISDEPRFGWRGAMLDVSRHFMPKDFVLKFIDLLSLHKLNILHWHLTDDQGWRIEIKRYPKLTEKASMRQATLIGHSRERPRRYDDVPHGGFYSQEEIREVVAYAAARQVTIVPEIDMPGHMQAAISAYPELGNTDMSFKPSLSLGH